MAQYLYLSSSRAASEVLSSVSCGDLLEVQGGSLEASQAELRITSTFMLRVPQHTSNLTYEPRRLMLRAGRGSGGGALKRPPPALHR
jgi:hypothetical protein